MQGGGHGERGKEGEEDAGVGEGGQKIESAVRGKDLPQELLGMIKPVLF